jgi:hypothetical protein
MLIGVLGVVVAIVILGVVLVQRSRARTAAAYAAARLMVVSPDPALRDLILSLWTQRPGGEILQRGEPLEVRLRTDLDAARRVLTALSS